MTTRKNNTAAATPATQPTIVLKTIHNEIVKSNPTTKLTTKDMRVVLRKQMSAIHIANASWIFTPSQADACRALFDPAFAERLARAAKRASKPSKKSVTSDAPASVDA